MSLFLTIFIPAYNEEENLSHTIHAIKEKLAATSFEKEILIVNDASTDNTAVVAEKITKENADVRVIHHQHNLNIGGAFRTAVENARGEWMILIPADLALQPADILRYIEAAPHADVVVGLRSDRSDYTLARRFVSFFNITLIQMLFGMKEKQFQYISMYKTSVLREMNIEFWRSAFFLAEIIIKAKALGKKLVEVEIKYAPRINGEATGAKFKLILLTMRDMFLFWLRWITLGALKASQKKER